MLWRETAYRDRGRGEGHLRGHGGARGGGTVALATTLTPLTSLPDTLTNAYKVVLCVRA